MQAAIEAADEIGLAVVATTFTLIAVFLPTAFMSGVVGQFFSQFGWTAVIAIFYFTVGCPPADTDDGSVYFTPIHLHPKPAGKLMTAYLQMVAWTLKHRTMTVAFASGFFYCLADVGIFFCHRHLFHLIR